jgi:hypothetical protein
MAARRVESRRGRFLKIGQRVKKTFEVYFLETCGGNFSDSDSDSENFYFLIPIPTPKNSDIFFIENQQPLIYFSA